MRALVIMALVVAAAAGPAPRAAYADEDPAIAEAQRLYNEGKRLYDKSKFAEALEMFEKAHDLYEAPEFLFNIAQCHRFLKDYEKAIFVYEAYLREKPNTGRRAEVEQFIAEMRTALDAETQSTSELARKRREAELAVIERRKQAELDRIERERAAEAERKDQASPPIYKKWWFWTIIGGVAIGAASGIAFATGGDELPGGSLGTIDGR